MLDRDLARLYGVETKVLNQAVKRNYTRFPADAMFQLTEIEGDFLRSQIVTSNVKRGGSRYKTFAFTELGIAMLSSVLNSDQAIQTNISIMRAFFEMRKLIVRDPDLSKEFRSLEKKSDHLFEIIFHRLDELELKLPILHPDRRKIGL